MSQIFNHLSSQVHCTPPKPAMTGKNILKCDIGNPFLAKEKVTDRPSLKGIRNQKYSKFSIFSDWLNQTKHFCQHSNEYFHKSDDFKNLKFMTLNFICLLFFLSPLFCSSILLSILSPKLILSLLLQLSCSCWVWTVPIRSWIKQPLIIMCKYQYLFELKLISQVQGKFWLLKKISLVFCLFPSAWYDAIKIIVNNSKDYCVLETILFDLFPFSSIIIRSASIFNCISVGLLVWKLNLHMPGKSYWFSWHIFSHKLTMSFGNKIQ